MHIYSILLSFMVVFSLASTGLGRTCKEVLYGPENIQLPWGVIHDIKAASRGDFYIPVYTKTIGGKKRTIVFLGESHLKTPEDSKLGRALLRHFDHRGNEGLQVENYWLPKLLKEALTYKPSKNRTAQSSILDAVIEPLVLTTQKTMVENFTLDVLKGERSLEDALNELNPESFKKNLDAMQGQPSEFIQIFMMVSERLDYSAIREAVTTAVKNGQALAPQTPGSPESERQIENYALEKGYKPNLFEKIGGVALGLGNKVSTKYCAIAMACIGAVGFVVPSQYSNAYFIGTIATTFSSISLAVVGMVGLPLVASVKRRNDFMLQSLNQILAKDPGIDKIIVTIGYGHLLNMMDKLEADGFSAVDLP